MKYYLLMLLTVAILSVILFAFGNPTIKLGREGGFGVPLIWTPIPIIFILLLIMIKQN
jgi:hypothetical protein